MTPLRTATGREDRQHLSIVIHPVLERQEQQPRRLRVWEERRLLRTSYGATQREREGKRRLHIVAAR